MLESNDPNLSSKYALFALYKNNAAVLHLFEDQEMYEAMKYKFTSNDDIKRLGASKLPENTTFKKLSESIQRKFNVPRERLDVRAHGREPAPKQEPVKPVNEMQRLPRKAMRQQIMEQEAQENIHIPSLPTATPKPQAPAEAPTISSFAPKHAKKIDLSRMNDSDRPIL
jgi:hypothetical protein